MACELNTCCSTAEQNVAAEESSTRGAFITAAAGPPCSEAWTGQIVGDYICFCTPEMFHIQWELWTCAVSIEPHWCQWGRCTEISLTDIISFLLLSLAENKCSNREILGCRGWSQQLNTKQMTFAASKKSPAEQQGGTDLQQAAVSCVWSGRQACSPHGLVLVRAAVRSL